MAATATAMAMAAFGSGRRTGAAWLALLLALFAFGGGPRPAEALVVLDHTNFTDFISENPFVLVEFYAPWCGHCRNLEPVLQSIERAAKAKHNFVIAKYDADFPANRDISKPLGVKGYPTVIAFAEGKQFRYTAPRKDTHFMKFLQKLGSDAVVDLGKNQLSLRESFPPTPKRERGFSSFLFVGRPGDHAAAYGAFVNAAKDLKDTSWFAKIEEPHAALADALKIEESGDKPKLGSLPCVVSLFEGEHYSEVEVRELPSSAEFGAQVVSAFVSSHLSPVFQVMNPITFRALGKRAVPVLLVVTDSKRLDKTVKHYAKAVRNLIPKYRDLVSFAVINGEEYHSWLYYTFGVTEMTTLPHFMLYEPVDVPRAKQFPTTGEAAKNKVAISEAHVETILQAGLLSDEVDWKNTGEWAKAKDLRDKAVQVGKKAYWRALEAFDGLKKRLVKTEL